MKQVELEVSRRENVGKGYARRLRDKGFIPGVLYGGGTNILLQLNAKDLRNALSTDAGKNVIINLRFMDKDDTKTVILKEEQIHPLHRNILHVDFYEISLKEKITTKVPIVLVGKSIGVKEGGILEQMTWEVDLRCLPTKIPEHIEVDISPLNINEAIFIKDLKMEEEIEILNDPEQTVVTITPPVVKEEEEIKEVVEPEVIRKKKEEETKE
ncbi:MAG: 50S ribosomal protein L25 [bacterium]|nr:50S ribosomal protein L25 [bacterium]